MWNPGLFLNRCALHTHTHTHTHTKSPQRKLCTDLDSQRQCGKLDQIHVGKLVFDDDNCLDMADYKFC